MRLHAFLLILLAASGCAKSTPLSPAEMEGPWRFAGSVSRLDTTGSIVPISGAELTVTDGVNLDSRVTSDSAGRYDFGALRGGRFTLTVAAHGYISVRPVVELFRDTNVNFALKPQ
jgi:hypothetical protein